MLLYDFEDIKQKVTAEQVAIDAGCNVKNIRRPSVFIMADFTILERTKTAIQLFFTGLSIIVILKPPWRKWATAIVRA